jgi:RHS repeat-associated protein
VRGRVSAVKNFTSTTAIWTSFKYNAINEQIEAMDDLGHTTFSTYDNFGRRTVRKHPDAGITNYSYDLAGNLRQLVTGNLKLAGTAITYTYDFERLTDIAYPQHPENNVKYSYGATGATDNRAGRIVLQEDATGAQEFFYGPLGEVVKNIRTVIIPQFGEQTYETQWTYDTWNRLTSMTYPDGEKVDYTYNVGGLLRSMDGKKKSSTFSYVKQLGYDKFEQRLFLAYGNGTKTTYNYEPDRRRLKNMTAQTSAKRLFMDNVYTYDKVNNILSLKNNAPVPTPNLMGGSSDYTYSYDDLYRLTSATGSFKGANDDHTYTLAMAYNTVGGITNKNQLHQRKGQEQKKTTYNNTYTYSEEQPHAPIHIGQQTFTYDANGNQLGWKDDKTGQRRNILWDEENRIRAVYDNGAYYHYTYDAAGERVLKGQSTGQRVFVNGQWKAGSGQMGNYTVYVNPYIVLRSGGYTKHYYIEGQRIVSKLGGGIDNNGKGPLQAGNGKVDYAARGQRVFDGIVKNLKFLGADGQILTAGKSGKIPPGQVNGTGNISEAFRYFYHPDHLGSTSYITDASGEVYQHLEYFAFGETFVEEHSNTNRTPWLFNGKELDGETGLYYYGARYYDARTSVWESVDSESDRMPSFSPYNYALNNPVILTDPDGRIPYPITIRGFAPFKVFGFGFHGDGRGYSVGDVSARVHQKINFDTDKTSMTTSAWSSPTSRVSDPGNKKTGTPSVKFTGDFTITNNGDDKTFGFSSHVAGGNPLTPKALTPNIDIFSDFSITENKRAGTLSISGKLTGDNFPSTEAFITDPSGQNVFIGVGQIGKGVGANTGPFTELPGENADRPITSFNFTIIKDKKGNFTGVKEGKTTYSISEWNKRFTSKPTQQE